MAIDFPGLDELIFDTLRKVSSHAPEPSDDPSGQLTALKDRPLTAFGITSMGFVAFWAYVNTHVGQCGGKPVSRDDQESCKTVGDVRKAVWKAADPKSLKRLQTKDD